jgi:hypothetical protein
MGPSPERRRGALGHGPTKKNPGPPEEGPGFDLRQIGGASELRTPGPLHEWKAPTRSAARRRTWRSTGSSRSLISLSSGSSWFRLCPGTRGWKTINLQGYST